MTPRAGGCSLACHLAARVTSAQGWVAAIGLPDLGLVAAAEAGVDLGRLVLVPAPGDQWPKAVAAMVDGFELLLLHPPGRPRAGDARRLAARVKERGSILILLDASWPESPDVSLTVEGISWEGLGQGRGRLDGRRVRVSAGGRRMQGRERHVELSLPIPAATGPATRGVTGPESRAATGSAPGLAGGRPRTGTVG